ncbi:MAG: AAA family ATPase [Myxococcota bacterium]
MPQTPGARRAVETAHRAVQTLRAALDAVVVGQREAKTGLLLALAARRHAYLEGPPGCAKTQLAETLGAASGARTVAVRFHRDTRQADLLGDPVLQRRRLRPAVAGRQRVPAGERLAFRLHPGPLLSAGFAILDDLSRAPGEALGPLLRILAERVALGRRLPLESAVATAAPPEADVYADPLEPSQLDRFAIQIELRGLVAARDWRLARSLIRGGTEPSAPRAALASAERRALQDRVSSLRVEGEARSALARLARRLAELCRGDESGLISDRAFAPAALSILRAHAVVVRRADRCSVDDLPALRFMLARRAPPAVREALPELIDEILHPKAPRRLAASSPRGQRLGQGGTASGLPIRVRGVESREVHTDLRGVPARAPELEAADVSVLLAALEGRLERGRAWTRSDLGGQPRRWRALEALDELLDADPVDASLFAQGRLPGSPRVVRRERRNAGGTLAVVRDVSASMEGRLSRWSGEIVAGIVRTGARQRMRMGYLEFNHQVERFEVAGAFFHRHYRKLRALAARRRSEGRTSYEAPLRTVLDEFGRRAGRNRHVVLITDGVPVVGDPEVRAERARAQRLGVRVHTVFLGLGACPAVLDRISDETAGLRFWGRPGPRGRLSVAPRGGSEERAA